MSRDERLLVANKAIEIIASHGRKFFSLQADKPRAAENRISKFLFVNGRLWFEDKYTGRRIYVAWRRGRWRGFSEGGTLRALIESMADWIIGKRPEFPLSKLGPFPEWVCGGDLWGYGEDMDIVRQEISRLAVAEGARPGGFSQETRDVKEDS